ncbi:hypothetical protein FRC01_007395 [Tulasnella sp. 417]|nr:hypothetical protein FRC01_007395 [Tulasnella sp. 417]
MIIASAFALCLATLALGQTDSTANTCARSYEVQSGDTCDGISAANNVSTYQLYTLNTDINDSCSNLWVGQTLCLGLSEGDCQTTYVVESGDYCWLIATNHGIDTETLLSNNPQVSSDCSNIYPGEVLCVSPEKLVNVEPDPSTTSTTSTTSTSVSETSTTSPTTTTSASDTASVRGTASITTTSGRASNAPGKHNGGKKGADNHDQGHKDEGKHEDSKKDGEDYGDDGQCRSLEAISKIIQYPLEKLIIKMFAPVVALAFAGFALAQSTIPGCARDYTVQEGDYCDKISAAHNVSSYQLAVSNYQTVNDGCTNLAVGQVICLGLTGADCATTYSVQSGDYCDLIASNNGINSTMLMTNNPQIDDNCYNLYVGQVLCVSKDVLVTPPPAGWTPPGSTLDDADFGSSDDVSDNTGSTTTTTTAPATTTTKAADKSTGKTSDDTKDDTKDDSKDDSKDNEEEQEEDDDDDCEDY